MSRRSTARLTWISRSETPLSKPSPSLEHVETIPGSEGGHQENRLILGDNLRAMQALHAVGQAGTVALAYLDPPFVSRARYTQSIVLPDGRMIERPVFDDAWPSLDAWLDMLYPRLRLVYTLLAETGSLYLQLDWRATHYARILLDEIFGLDAFRNEIVWKRAPLLGRKADSGQFGRVTDTILFYTKSDRFTFNRPTLEREIDRRQARWDAQQQRWYRTSPPGDYTDASLAQLDRDGRIHETRTGRRRVKYFLTETADGRLIDQLPLDNLWLDIPDMMHLPTVERTGYPTQKPLALLRRIVQVSSQPGDLVLDPFAGGGTTLVVAAELGRRWLGIDASTASLAVARSRLLDAKAGSFTVFRETGRQGNRETGKQGGRGAGQWGSGEAGEQSGGEVRIKEDRPLPLPLSSEERGVKTSQSPPSLVGKGAGGLGSDLPSAEAPQPPPSLIGKGVGGLGPEQLSDRVIDEGKPSFTVSYVSPSPLPPPPSLITNHPSLIMSLQSLVSNLQSLEYWSVDWDYDGVFRSDWQAWRGYNRSAKELPTQTPPYTKTTRQPIAVRWERLDGVAGLEIIRLDDQEAEGD